jgi:hypothetical protein
MQDLIPKALIFGCSKCKSDEIRIYETEDKKVRDILEEEEWYVDPETNAIFCDTCSSAITCEQCGEIELIPEVVNYDNGPTSPEFKNSSWIFEERLFFCCMNCKEEYENELKGL